jgi:two-component system sensor histidine kinase/response regulator
MSVLPHTEGEHLGMRPLSSLPRRVRLLGAAWAAAIIVVTAILVHGGRSSITSQILGSSGFLAALIFCTVACVRVARKPSPTRLGWLLMAIAMGIGALGQTNYVITAVTRAPSGPSPVLDGIAFLGYAGPSLAAVLAFPRPADPLISRFRGLLDVIVITLGVVLIGQATILRTVREVADVSTFDGLLKFAYPISDIAICAVVLCVAIRQLPGDRLTWLFLGGGLVAVALTDSIYVRLLAEGQTELTATPLVAGWMAAPVLIGLATLIPMTSHTSESSGVTLAVRLIPYVPVLGAMIVFGLGLAQRDNFLQVAGVLMLIVVTVRQVMIVYENVSLTRDLEAKVAARTSELATLGSIVTSFNDAIVGISLDNVVTAWNPAAERLYGYRAVDVLGRPPTFLEPSGFDALEDLLGSARNGEQLVSYELDWPRADGTTVPVAMTVSPIVDGGEVEGISISGQDITERRRTAEALEQAREEALESSRLKSEFLATMSHEIRTPMNGVIGLTTLLLETKLDEGQRTYAEGVRGAGEALLSVINDILDFSKLEAGKVVLDPSDFDLRKLVDEVGSLLAPAASAKGLELIAYCLPDVPSAVVGDPGRIRQILLNLASNAVKFTSSGEVAVKVRSFPVSGELVRMRFEVVDTGIGIAEQDRGRLFESFSQADASTTRRFGGTGLGLAISRRLVEVMGGHIGLDSELSVGSTFWFEIPLRLGSPVPLSDDVLSHDLLNDLRVLVVDDNATNRTILEAQLRSWHMQPDSVADATSGFELLRARAAEGRPYDLATLDMMMPDIDGFELARRIGDDPVLHGLPLIMLTSSSPLPSEAFHQVGIGQWLSKPVRSSELYDRLVRLMAPKEAELSARRRSRRDRPYVRPGSRGQILVVEDNNLNQLVAEGVVSRLGFDVHTVSDGLEAIRALEEQSYCAVLMDCHMPTMDGFTATREIRRREIGRSRMPIIAMTAGALPEDRERCLAAGMDAYISKPVDLGALEVMLDEWAGAPVEPLQAVDLHPKANPAVLADEPIDHSRLADLRELESPDGSSLLESMIASFISRGVERLGALRRALRAADHKALADAAHELKGSAGTIGAVRVAELCRQLENSARVGVLPASELVDELEVELGRANRTLLDLNLQPS